MKIRDANPTDLELLFEIRCSVKENHMSREQLAKAGITLESVKAMIEGGDYITKIAEEDGKAVAFCMAQVSEKYVFAVFVRPVHENKGYGRARPSGGNN